MAVQTSAPDEVTDASLSRSMAADVSEFLIANVPPNPQHVSASVSSIRLRPRTFRNNSSGLSPIPSCPQRMAGGGKRHGAGNRHRRPDIQNVDQEFREFVAPGRQCLGLLRQSAVARPASHHRMLVAHGTDARTRWCDDRLASGFLERCDMVADEYDGVVQISAVDMHLTATGLVGRKDHLVTESFQQCHGGDRGCRKQGVCQACHEESDLHPRNRTSIPVPINNPP